MGPFAAGETRLRVFPPRPRRGGVAPSFEDGGRRRGSCSSLQPGLPGFRTADGAPGGGSPVNRAGGGVVRGVPAPRPRRAGLPPSAMRRTERPVNGPQGPAELRVRLALRRAASDQQTRCENVGNDEG